MGDIIGLTGRKFHGKDTVAGILVERGYKQLRFADPLKNMLRAFYDTMGLPPWQVEIRIEGELKERPCSWLRGKTPRYAMQTLGTEWGRGLIHNDLWIETLKSRSQKHWRVVVSDVRFLNEVNAIKDLGGRVFRVDAGARVPSNEHSNHASETEIDNLPVDGVIDNSGSLESLKDAVDQALSTRSPQLQPECHNTA